MQKKNNKTQLVNKQSCVQIGARNSPVNHENLQYSVLHIDDDQFTLQLSKYFLEEVCSNDNLVIESESDSTRIQTWLYQDHDCYLVDYSMPNMNGLAVCQKIRELKDTPIILFTSKEPKDIPLDSFEKLDVKYHQKSSDPENYFTLSDAIMDLVRQDIDPTSKMIK